jgi:L-alanine-DL-glutamate epimerase-like enolase superfamily enzyme
MDHSAHFLQHGGLLDGIESRMMPRSVEEGMKITEVTALVLRLPEVSAACDGTQDTCLIRIDTDEGITGWGEVDSCPTVVKAIIDAPLSHQICNGLRNALMGADPLEVDDCMQRMDSAANYYGRTAVGAHAQAGINIALWDILGKARNKPICELLGEPHKRRFRAYCSILFGDTPAETAELARQFADKGFTAIKFGWGPMGQDEENDIALVRAARQGAGEKIDILVDAGQVWDWETALRRAHSFNEFGIFFLEEALHPEDISEQSPVPIAGGEAEARDVDFERLMVEGGLHWIQPDPGRCGISHFVNAGRMAHEHGRMVVNHSFKSGITIAASLHALSTSPNAEICEFCMADSPLRHEITREIFELDDEGHVSIPEGPGLGVTINEATIERYRVA